MILLSVPVMDRVHILFFSGRQHLFFPMRSERLGKASHNVFFLSAPPVFCGHSKRFKLLFRKTYLCIMSCTHVLLGLMKNQKQMTSKRPVLIIQQQMSRYCCHRDKKHVPLCQDKVVCPNCMYTTCNSLFFVRAATVHSGS